MLQMGQCTGKKSDVVCRFVNGYFAIFCEIMSWACKEHEIAMWKKKRELLLTSLEITEKPDGICHTN